MMDRYQELAGGGGCGLQFDSAAVHHYKNPDSYQSGFFARSPSNGEVWRIFLLSRPALETLFFAPRTPFSVSILCGALERSSRAI